jgi:diguanylate cyclase
VDDFKSFNERFSHPGGDLALRHVARFLQGDLRGSDWVARYGGDEFAFVLTTNVTLESAEAVAARVCDRLAALACHELRGHPHVPVTIGGVVFPEDAQDFDALTQRASETALEQKKRQKGRPLFWRRLQGG